MRAKAWIVRTLTLNVEVGRTAQRCQAAGAEKHLRLLRKLLRCQRQGPSGAWRLGIFHYSNKNDISWVVQGLRVVVTG
jgi:hypothetical protein